ncbi:MAG: efflux RND transporter periplasmic adaptor subunit [Proteobacteria bacterium]|nr:efflux RND transporter periplasmic adaptor subunit [Pseudomonadota bacterium]MBI3495775.1 efflux RND transporter periplasmic adaptor subunit [Pseudomonadota bacterium]
MAFLKTALGISTALVLTGVAAFFAFDGLSSRSGVQAANPPAQGGAPSGIPVPVAAVVRKTVPVYLDYVGTTESVRSIALQAKVTGYLAERGQADGADVKQGDLLYRIDPRDYQAALDQAKAQAKRDAAALDYAKANLQRGSQLIKDGWVTKDAFDLRASSQHQAEAALAADQAAIRAAENNLGYTEIRAPFSGRLGKSQAYEGALIGAAGTQLNTLAQLDPIYVTFNPSEKDLTLITQRQAKGAIAADALLAGDSEASFRGRLTFLDNAVDRSTGTIVARVTIDNPERSLLPGQYVRVRLHIGDLPDALLVAQTALGSNQLGKFVYVVGEGNRVEQRFVKTGASYGPLVVIGEGVKEGESVIVGNLQKIGPGAPVTPLAPKG